MNFSCTVVGSKCDYHILETAYSIFTRLRMHEQQSLQSTFKMGLLYDDWGLSRNILKLINFSTNFHNQIIDCLFSFTCLHVYSQNHAPGQGIYMRYRLHTMTVATLICRSYQFVEQQRNNATCISIALNCLHRVIYLSHPGANDICC